MGVEATAVQPAPYDFGVSSRLSREAVVGLKRIHATAADELEVLLSRSFGAAITEANMVSKELHVISMDGLLEQELLAALNTTNGSELLDATTL